MSRARPIEIRLTQQNGRLRTGLSAENVGIGDWTIKQDFRRKLDLEVLSEGHDRFAPNPLNAIMPVVGGEAITLTAMARRPNGRIAVIVGTKTKLFRYFGVDNGAYFDSEYFEAAATYFDDNPGAWIQIGSNFSANGQRWEAVAINGYLVLNNGYDLPVTYRVEDFAVQPIYELREQGIASVGTICEHDGILVCSDIRQIKAAKHVEIMTPLAAAINGSVNGIMSGAPAMGKINSGVDGVNGNTITANLVSLIPPGAVYNLTFGFAYTITNLIPGQQYTLISDGTAGIVQEGPLINGVYYNPTTLFPVTGVPLVFTAHGNGITFLTLVSGQPINIKLYAGGQPFLSGNGFLGLVGRTVRMANGLQRTITAAASQAVATVNGTATKVEPYQGMYFPQANDKRMGQTIAALFPSLAWAATADAIGLKLFWASGEVRTIKSIAGGYYFLDSDMPIAAGVVSIENPAAYQAFADEASIEHFHWRILWSMPNEPRRFGAIIPCTVNPASNILKLKYPVRSLSAGQAILILNAGTGGANLTADIAFAYANQLVLADGVITGAASDILAAIAVARADEAQAQIVVTSTGSTLAVALEALDGATAASAAAPNDAALKKAVVDASAKVDTARAANTAAIDALAKATTVRQAVEGTLQPADTQLMAADAFASITGKFYDLQGDGSRIIRAMTLRQQLIVYKANSSIFIGTYTGNVDTPFVFRDLETPATKALRYRDTLVAINGDYHLYAGEDAFYRLDLVNRTPIEVGLFQLCAEVFFKADRLGGEDRIFAADNQVTQEIFFFFPSTGTDKALRFDYRWGTVSTSALDITAACSVQRPESQVTGQAEIWFVMGSPAGLVLRYGLINGEAKSSGVILASKLAASNQVTCTAPLFTSRMIGKSIRTAGGKWFAISGYVNSQTVTVLGAGAFTAERFTIENAIYHRDGAGYDGILQSGADSFGSADMEKLLNGYVILLGSKSPSVPVQIALRGGINPSEVRDVLTATITLPLTNNLVPAVMQGYYLGDRITVTGINHLIQLAGRSIGIGGIDTRSYERKP